MNMTRISIALALVALPLLAVADAGWVTNPGNGHRYKAQGCGNWLDCEAAAVVNGGHLATVRSASEQAWLVQQFGGTTQYWIGLTDQASEGQFAWTSGEPPGFSNWAPGEPNNYPYSAAGEDYVVMNWNAPGNWNDAGPGGPEWTSITHGIVEVVASQAINGRVGGASSFKVVCTNATTGQTITKSFKGDQSWDCLDMGLVVRPGDKFGAALGGTMN